MNKTNYYSDEKNVQILIALLKEHGIKHIIASPGTTNSAFVASVQFDDYFKVYSSVDERSAAYLACGLSSELNEPVVITCTGATASRNYFPGITEAYYRKLPILAVTGTQAHSKVNQLAAQVIDRSVQPVDTYTLSVKLSIVKDQDDEYNVGIKTNKAILELLRRGGGPVHIDLETNYIKSFETKELPTVKKIDRFYPENELPPINKRKVAIFIGSHRKFSELEIKAIECFCETNNAVVFYDYTSNYNGKYGVNMALVASQKFQSKDAYVPEIMIHIGEVSGDYPSMGINMGPKGAEVWRVSPDGEIRDTFRKLRNVFEMQVHEFFSRHSGSKKAPEMDYYAFCERLDQEIRTQIPDLPFSNIWLASQLAHKIPEKSVIHFGILNSLRSWNLFHLPDSVRSSCNVGGFGIDGGMSTLVGASLVNPDKLYFLVIGDLAFFYDMNVLGNRHVGNNLRILLVNNGRGTEFRQYDHHTSHFEEFADDYIAAAGHFGNKSKSLVKGYAEALGLKYQSAASKEEFDKISKELVSPEIKGSSIFELFTDSNDEAEALRLIMNIKVDKKTLKNHDRKELFRRVIGQKNIQKIKEIVK